MAQTLVTKEGKITNVVTMSVERCRALEDPARAAILHILSHKPMSTEGLVRELHKNGYPKAVTTTRHHIEILRDCGLIEVVRLREVRGAVEKYYAPTIKFLGLEDSFSVEGYSALIGETSRKLLKVMLSMAQRYSSKIKSTSGSSCRYCGIHHGREYVLFEIMNRALALAARSGEFLQVQKLIESQPGMSRMTTTKTMNDDHNAGSSEDVEVREDHHAAGNGNGKAGSPKQARKRKEPLLKNRANGKNSSARNRSR